MVRELASHVANTDILTDSRIQLRERLKKRSDVPMIIIWIIFAYINAVDEKP